MTRSLAALLLIPIVCAFCAEEGPAPVRKTGLLPSSAKPGLYRGKAPAPLIPNGHVVGRAQGNLPASADNSAGLPPVGDQGSHGTCNPWATGYYYKSYQEAKEHGWDVTRPEHQFSPEFLYNQTAPGDEGTTFDEIFNLILDQGCATLEADWPYTDTGSSADVSTFPSYTSFKNALPYRSQSYTRLGDGLTPGILNAMKSRLAGGDLCVIGMPVMRPSLNQMGRFEKLSAADFYYNMPADDDRFNAGGHALAVVGYDDAAFGGKGGFKIVNQWGTGWGKQGFAYLSYQFVAAFVFDVYVMDDRIGYQPSASLRFKASHSYWWYDGITVMVGTGSIANPTWSKTILASRQLEYDYVSVDMAVDITEAIAYLPPTAAQQWWIVITDNSYEDAITLSAFDITTNGVTVTAAAVMPLKGPEFTGNCYAFLPAGTNTSSSYYINDDASTGDAICSAPGNDANDGLTPATPKRSVQAVIDQYTLKPGDTVWIDAGTYLLSADITLTQLDRGASGVPVRFAGVIGTNGEPLTILNRGGASGACFNLNAGASYVQLENMWLQAGANGVNVDGSQSYGSEEITLKNVRISGANSYGCSLYEAGGCVFQNCLIYGCDAEGISVYRSSATVDHCTIAANPGKQCVTLASSSSYYASGSGLALTNSIFSATGNSSCIYDNRNYTMLNAVTSNTFFGSNGALTGITIDGTNMTSDPIFANPAGGDFRLQSSAGHWSPAANAGAGGWIADAQDSPCIDASNVQYSVGSEPLPNGGRANLGFDGGSAFASKTAIKVRALALDAPSTGKYYSVAVPVVWRAVGELWSAGDTLKAEYTIDAGANWLPIPNASGIPYDALTFSWLGAPKGTYQVRVTCNQDISVTAMSSAFTLYQPVNYYVNDASTTNDMYCTAAGSAAGDGLTPGTPKNSIQAIIDTYDLDPGDIVYIDTGVYTLTADIVLDANDSGAAGYPLRFVGSTHPNGSIINRNYTSGTAFRLNSSNNVSLEFLRFNGAYYGVYFPYCTGCSISDCRIYGNTYGVDLYQGSDIVIQRCIIYNNASNGIYMYYSSRPTITSNTIVLNANDQIYQSTSSTYSDGMKISNNIIWSNANGFSCVRYYSTGSVAASDYNDLYATNGGQVGPFTGQKTLSGWQAGTGFDAHSLNSNPLFVDADGADNIAGNDDDDFHLQSSAGSWHGGAFNADANDSPCIDAGNPADKVGLEPLPNGGRINLGAFGGTAQASKSPTSRVLTLSAPNGGEVWQGTQIIAWQTTGTGWQPADTLRIEYSADNGGTWTPIAGASSVNASAGSLSWDTTLAAPNAGVLFRVRITCNQNAAVFKISEGSFVLHNQSINYYVNDASTSNDIYCTAAGLDTNSGLTPATPKATIRALLNAYTLLPGDNVNVDSGTYALSADIVIPASASGTTNAPLTIRGASGRTVLVRSGTTGSCISWLGTSYVNIEGFEFRGGAYGASQNNYGYNPMTLKNNVFVSNAAYGVYVYRGTLTLTNNTFYSAGSSCVYAGSSDLYLSGNIFYASGAGKACLALASVWSAPKSYANVYDYNCYYAVNGATAGMYYAGGTLAEWQASMGQDAHSISNDPLFVDAAGFDLHLQSSAGSWHGGAFTPDAGNSPCIDAGDPAAAASAEPQPNGGRVNLGAFSGTAQASKSPAARVLTLAVPNGGEIWQGTKTVTWRTGGSGWQASDTLRIEYSSNNGSNWTPIAGASSVGYDNGAWNWDTASAIPNSGASFRVRVTCNQSGATADISDNVFMLHNQPIYYYVNDAVTTNDVYCTAAGSAVNDGLTPATPKNSIQAIIDTYNLEAGDVVLVDTGVYTPSADITIGPNDCGAEGSPVRIVGSTHPSGTVINRNPASGYIFSLSSCSYLSLENLRLKGSTFGVYASYCNGCTISDCPVYGNNTGIYIYQGSDMTINRCVINNNTSVGIYMYYTYRTAINNCTVALNGLDQISQGSSPGYDGLKLSNNVIWANSSNYSCIKYYSTGSIAASDYNDLYATNGAVIGTGYTNLAAWQTGMSLDAHSISVNPMFVDADGPDNIAGNDDDDFHLQSTLGSWHGGAFTADANDSLCIDAGNPADALGGEPLPNGGRINLGAFGGTAQASKSTRRLALMSPKGGEEWNSVQTIKWDVNDGLWNAADTVTLTYSPDNGANWLPVPGGANVLGTSEQMAWNVTQIQTGNQYLVRVVHDQNPANTDTSLPFTVGFKHKFFVNDASTVGDEYCSAAGDDANGGLSALTPKASVQAILDTYALQPGDVIYIDAGTYTLNADIVVSAADEGSAAGLVRLTGVKGKTILDRGAPAGSGNCITVAGKFVSIENLTLRSAVTGLYVTGTNCQVLGNTISNCSYNAFHAYSGDGLMFANNTILHSGTSYAVYLRTYSYYGYYPFPCTIANNTIVATNCTAIGFSTETGPVLRNNIITTSGTGCYCMICYDGLSLDGSDYNLLRASNGAKVGRIYYYDFNALSDWTSAIGWDIHSFSGDPLFANSAGGDFHLKSVAGRYDPSSGKPASDPSTWVIDGASSPAIDAGDPADSVGLESAPNGGRINLGADGGTAEASRSGARAVILVSPRGGELWRGIKAVELRASGSSWAAGDTLRVEYSTDAGANWNAVNDVVGIPYDQTIFWWDTRAVPDGFNYRLRVVSIQSAAVSDASVSTFTISNAPIGIADAYSTNEDTALSVAAPGVLGNDFDAKGSPLSASIVTNPAHGTLALNSSGALIYTPALNFNGTDSFTYQAGNGETISAATTVTLTVTPANDAPIATAGSFSTNEDIPYSGMLSATDLDGNALTYSVVSFPTKGSVVITNNLTGAFTYTPNLNVSGTDTFIFRVNDGTVNSNTATMTITVIAVNDAPTISDIADRTINEDASTGAIGFTIGDVETSASLLTLSAASSNTALVPAGNIVLGGSGASRSVTVTPLPNQNGNTTITITVSDGLLTASDSFVLTVTPVNDAPVAVAGSFTTNEDMPYSGMLAATDLDGNVLTYSIVSNGTQGSAVISNATAGLFTYAPLLNVSGIDTFTFRVNDGMANSNTATITVTILAVNDAPVANSGSFSTNEDTSFSGLLSGSDAEGSALTYSIVANGTIGSVAITNAATGAFTYTPALNANGIDTFTFIVNDGTANSSTATMTVTIVAVNDAPVATAANFSTDEDTPFSGMLTATDVDGDALTYTIVTNGMRGTMVLTNASTGAFTYTPLPNMFGFDLVTFKVSDGIASSTASATVAINAINDAPTISDIADVRINSNSNTGALAFFIGDVETGASALGLSATSTNATLAPVSGIVFSGSGVSRTVTVTPAPNQFGNATITVIVSDGSLSASDSFVLSVNSVPTAGNAAIAVLGDGVFSGTLAASDADGDALVISIVTNGSKGTAAIANAASGAFTYTPALNVDGIDTFTFRASDGKTLSNLATVSVTITAHNDPPTISGIAGQTIDEGGSTGALAFTVGDLKVSANALTVSATSSNENLIPASSIVFGGSGANRTIGVTPGANLSGSSTVILTVSNGAVTASTAFIVTVLPVNDPPVAGNLVLSTYEDTPVSGTLTATDADGDVLSYSIVANGSKGIAVVTNAAGGAFTYTPLPNASGIDTFKFKASDGNASAEGIVTVTIEAINDAPTIGEIGAQTIDEDGSTGAIGFEILDVDNTAESLSLTALSSDATLAPAGSIVFGGSGAKRTVTVTPAPHQSGSATISVSVGDGALRSSRQFLLTVVPRLAFVSAPIATPNPAHIGEVVHFAAAAAAGQAVSWEFGDGTTAAESSPAHAYALAGSYTVTARLSEGARAVVAQLGVQILPDEELKVLKASVGFNFKLREKHDSMSLSGTLELAEGFNPAGAKFTLSMGGFESGAIDMNGKGIAATAAKDVAFKLSLGKSKGNSTAFTLTMKNQTMFEKVKVMNFVEQASKVSIPLAVRIGLGERYYSGSKGIVYSAVEGKSGKGK